VWQCRRCRRQSGVRAGTVMADSRIGLLPWFRLVELVIRQPDVSLATLAERTGIRRRQTLRRMVNAVRQAMDSPDSGRRLAGLDQLCG
jgi:hypothetical protein